MLHHARAPTKDQAHEGQVNLSAWRSSHFKDIRRHPCDRNLCIYIALVLSICALFFLRNLIDRCGPIAFITLFFSGCLLSLRTFVVLTSVYLNLAFLLIHSLFCKMMQNDPISFGKSYFCKNSSPTCFILIEFGNHEGLIEQNQTLYHLVNLAKRCRNHTMRLNIMAPFGWLVFKPAGWFLLTAALFINQPLQYFSHTQSVAIVFLLLFSDKRIGP